ncbi:MAG: flagellin FliC, partial [Bdellovibrionota bacterium]
MSLRIATNIQAIAAQRALGLNYEAQGRAMEHLASGSRINRAGEDAAGLAISEKLKSSIRSMKQMNRNANDGISLVQTAEGAMNEVGNILIRLRELSIQGASDTIGDVERSFINKEVQGLKSEIDRISNSTEFNGTKLLDGSSPVLEFQIGLHNNPMLDRFVFDTTDSVTTASALGIDTVATKAKV